MVSDTVKKVLDMYEDGMIFKLVVIISKERGVIRPYHTLLLDSMETPSTQAAAAIQAQVQQEYPDTFLDKVMNFLPEERKRQRPMVI